MLPLDKKYQDELDGISAEIQACEELQTYLDTEEDEDFMRLREMFEPRMAGLYDRVALNDSLQLIAFEKALLNEQFEGLFLPKILGYAVLRGELNERMKYMVPQEHFKDILVAICDSANFDILKKRIGQTIQMGFACSSDIWVTNLINLFTNKRVRYFLQGQKLDKYRDIKGLKAGLFRYKKQFVNENYFSAIFPATIGDLKAQAKQLRSYLKARIIKFGDNNQNVIPQMNEFIANEDFHNTKEHLQILGMYCAYFNLEGDDKAHASKIFNKIRKEWAPFKDEWLQFLLDIHESELDLDKAADTRISEMLDPAIQDDLTNYYALMDTIHAKGYTTPEAQEATKNFYNQYEGMSMINECVRKAILNYLRGFISKLIPSQYEQLFEISKTYNIYMQIFLNQHFNNSVKDMCMTFVRKCLRVFTDKRAKDYQEVKRFVSTSFVDAKFLKEKEVVELFKTRRKRKKPTA